MGLLLDWEKCEREQWRQCAAHENCSACHLLFDSVLIQVTGLPLPWERRNGEEGTHLWGVCLYAASRLGAGCHVSWLSTVLFRSVLSFPSCSGCRALLTNLWPQPAFFLPESGRFCFRLWGTGGLSDPPPAKYWHGSPSHVCVLWAKLQAVVNKVHDSTLTEGYLDCSALTNVTLLLYLESNQMSVFSLLFPHQKWIVTSQQFL
jgi:hypothetical protein